MKLFDPGLLTASLGFQPLQLLLHVLQLSLVPRDVVAQLRITVLHLLDQLDVAQQQIGQRSSAFR
ncbi:hypothetical protein D3C76_1805030 [compost metagenome]